MVTTEALGEFAGIHHRMPLVLPRHRWAEWLDPGRTDASELLGSPGPDVLGSLTAHPVSTEVNNMRNNRPGLLEPVEPAPPPAEQTALFEP